MQNENQAECRHRVAVMGLGHVGLPVARAYAGAGHQVFGIDVDQARIEALRVDADPVLTRARAEGRLDWGEDPANLAGVDIIFVCVPTPQGDDHLAVRECAAQIADHASPGALVILESTVRPGFVRELHGMLPGFDLAYAPERIDPGRPTPHAVRRLVAGIDETSRQRASQVLREAGIRPIPVDLPVAEYAKLLENAYRLVNVAFIDQFAALCRAEGVPAHAVVQAAATKPYGFQAFTPGAGAGGHCIAVDPHFLADRGRAVGNPIPLLESALRSNQDRPARIAQRVEALTSAEDTLLVVGLTYKPGVADLRESGALTAARILQERRSVVVFDPLVEPPGDLDGVDLHAGLNRADAVLALQALPTETRDALRSSGLPLFDASGTLAEATEV